MKYSVLHIISGRTRKIIFQIELLSSMENVILLKFVIKIFKVLYGYKPIFNDLLISKPVQLQVLDNNTNFLSAQFRLIVLLNCAVTFDIKLIFQSTVFKTTRHTEQTE